MQPFILILLTAAAAYSQWSTIQGTQTVAAPRPATVRDTPRAPVVEYSGPSRKTAPCSMCGDSCKCNNCGCDYHHAKVKAQLAALPPAYPVSAHYRPMPARSVPQGFPTTTGTIARSVAAPNTSSPGTTRTGPTITSALPGMVGNTGRGCSSGV
jgi:hypothetical protein